MSVPYSPKTQFAACELRRDEDAGKDPAFFCMWEILKIFKIVAISSRLIACQGEIGYNVSDK